MIDTADWTGKDGQYFRFLVDRSGFFRSLSSLTIQPQINKKTVFRVFTQIDCSSTLSRIAQDCKP
ncbi:MAG: hypothetical protein OEZ58_11350 [Gammaproteobacteria bacterium]|nr:hypothetical protein [Gammaproteobacteria bacterium]